MVDNFTIRDINLGLKQKKFSCQEITSLYLKKALENKHNAYISFDEEGALAKAEEIDKKIKAGKEIGILAGVPIAVKDVIMTKNLKTTAASKTLENYTAVYDATVVEKLKEAGVVILGKTNCDEFAMGSSNENSYFGPVKNPWDLKRVPGGSSGGSAAVVSEPADEAVFSLGTDTGGSIRQPAAFCGVVGFKPTYGRVSRYGLIALASSLDQIGPLTKNVEDAAVVMQQISGLDKHDATSSDQAVPEYFKDLITKPKDLTIGLPKECFSGSLNSEIKDKINYMVELFKKEGFKIKEISLPTIPYALACYYIIQPAEASANLARYDGLRYGFGYREAEDLEFLYQLNRKEGFGDEVRRRIIIGTFVLSAGYKDAYYKKAQAVRQLIIEDFQKAFADVDLIITPTTPEPAFAIGEKISDPLSMYLSDIYTVSINISGLPAISLPIGFTKQKLPIGMQIIGNYYKESEILRLAKLVEGLVR